MLALMDRATTVWTIPIVGRAKGRVIRRLLDRHRPTRGIELGSLLGYSAILIAGSMPPRGRLTCVEANPFLAWMVRANVAEAGLARRVKVVAGDALRVIPLLADSTSPSSTPRRKTISTTSASSSRSSSPAPSSSPTTPASHAARSHRTSNTCATAAATTVALTTSRTTPWRSPSSAADR
jgi:O-methyltransferase